MAATDVLLIAILVLNLITLAFLVFILRKQSYGSLTRFEKQLSNLEKVLEKEEKAVREEFLDYIVNEVFPLIA